MPSKKLTQKTVDRMKAPDPSGRQTMFWDNSMRGFGVRVSGSTNQKSYIAQRTLPMARTEGSPSARPKGSPAGARQNIHTYCRWIEFEEVVLRLWSLYEARAAARKSDLAADPHDQQGRKRASA